MLANTCTTPDVTPHSPSSRLDAITVSGLAELLGCPRATINHYARLLGLRFRTRFAGPRRKQLACLSTDDAGAVVTVHEAAVSAASTLPLHHHLPRPQTPAPASNPATPNNRPNPLPNLNPNLNLNLNPNPAEPEPIRRGE